MAVEPSFSAACDWWSDTPAICTPVGWPDHLFGFNVLWNGTVLAEPHVLWDTMTVENPHINTRTRRWKDRGVQVTFSPSPTSHHFPWELGYLRNDDGTVRQSWSKSAAPVLCSEWSRDGLLLEKQCFAHIPGADDVATGLEPLFMWIRLRIKDRCPGLPIEAQYGFNILLQALHVKHTMSIRDSIRFDERAARYPHRLKATRQHDSCNAGLCITEKGGVRLAIVPGCRDCVSTEFFPSTDRDNHDLLHVSLPTRPGAHVDLLLPMLPVSTAIFRQEQSVGFDGALRSARAFWTRTLRCATTVSVPEAVVNDTLQHSIRASLTFSEKSPSTGRYCKLSGSWPYADLWSTPTALELVHLLDSYGYHAKVERYLEIYRHHQGTVVPPGSAYTLHPGYLSTPAEYKAFDWLSDHGAILYAIAMHGVLSGKAAFIRRFTPSIVNACEWIQDVRAMTGHDGYTGVLPPACAPDNQTEIQGVFSIGWVYKGLCAAVELLQRISHPRADEFATEAESYKRDFLTAFTHRLGTMPRWRDRTGAVHRLVPTSLSGHEDAESRHAFYLDTGPLFLVFSGLMNATDEPMTSILRWFREGPQRRFNRFDGSCWQVPVLYHEMSSCEPMYSWNAYHSWQLGDRERFLECMYSVLAGGVSRQTYISCETRGGVTGCVFSATFALHLARLAVIDDQIEPRTLHLLRLAPSAWFSAGKQGRWVSVPTRFGPVTLTTNRPEAGGALEVSWTAKFRGTPPCVMLHMPLPGSKNVVVNGKRRRFTTESILI